VKPSICSIGDRETGLVPFIDRITDFGYEASSCTKSISADPPTAGKIPRVLPRCSQAGDSR